MWSPVAPGSRRLVARQHRLVDERRRAAHHLDLVLRFDHAGIPQYVGGIEELVLRHVGHQRLMLLDRVEEALLLDADPLAAIEPELVQDVGGDRRRMVPVINLGDPARPGEFRRVQPFEVAHQEDRLAKARDDDAMVFVIAGGFVADDIGDVLRPPHQQRVELHPGHRVLDQVVAADIFLGRKRQALMDEHRQVEAAAGAPRRWLERHLLGMARNLDDLPVLVELHRKPPFVAICTSAPGADRASPDGH